jgi:hypothetical protein
MFTIFRLVNKIIMTARPLGILDIIVIAILIIVAAIVIVFLWPLVVLVAIIAAAYFIYKWYKRERVLR